MSRPTHASAFGVSRARARTAVCGSVFVNSDGQMAMRTNTTMSPAETQNTGFFLRCFQAWDVRDRATSCSPGGRTVVASTLTAAVASVMADPRVEHAVQEVDEQVHDQEDEY